MNNIYEEIRENSGIDDMEYLEEGIVFFKNSDKMKRLSKKLTQKHSQLIKGNKMSEASALSSLINEVDRIALSFETVEREFRNSRGKDEKNVIKTKYNKLEKQFIELIKIANKESVKKAIAVAGVSALIVGVLAAGAFGMHSFLQAGVLDNAALNIRSRAELFDLKDRTRPMEADSNMEKLRKVANRSIGGGVISQTIKATNKDLVSAATVAGATAAGVLSAGVIGELRKIGIKNKTIAATVRAIEGIKNSEGKKSKEEV